MRYIGNSGAQWGGVGRCRYREYPHFRNMPLDVGESFVLEWNKPMSLGGKLFSCSGNGWSLDEDRCLPPTVAGRPEGEKIEQKRVMQ